MTFTYCTCQGNVGDETCSPIDYFTWKEPKTVHFDYSNRGLLLQSTDPLIIGGGGLFIEGIEGLYEDIVKAGKRVVVWGAGTNYIPADIPCRFPEALRKCELVGVRDFGTRYEYLPCVSCLRTEFDLSATPVYSFMVYSHHARIIPIDAPLKITNNISKNSLSSVVKALLSSETIITNSYHGAYWGMLLQRRVVLFEPWGNKFMFFKHMPDSCNRKNWRFKLRGPPTAPRNFLTECRELNVAFHERVRHKLYDTQAN